MKEKIVSNAITEAKIISKEDLKSEELKMFDHCLETGRREMENRRKLRSKGRWILCKIGIHIPRDTQIGKVCARCQKHLD